MSHSATDVPGAAGRLRVVMARNLYMAHMAKMHQAWMGQQDSIKRMVN